MIEKMNDLEKRLFDFAVRIIRYLRTLPETPYYKIIRYQLIKSSFSSGANYEELYKIKVLSGTIAQKSRLK